MVYNIFIFKIIIMLDLFDLDGEMYIKIAALLALILIALIIFAIFGAGNINLKLGIF